MKKARNVFLLLGVLALSLAGCGSSGGNSSSISSSSSDISSSESTSSTPSSSSSESTSSYTPPTHVHVPSENYYSNSKNHWKKCVECGNHLDEAPHTFGEWEVIKEATKSEEGLQKRECTVCGYSESNTIPKKVEKTINLTIDNPNGGVLESTSLTGYVGADVTATVSLNSGYSFDGWYDRRSKLSDKQTYTFTLLETTPDLKAKIITNEVNYKVEHYQGWTDDYDYKHVEEDDEILSGKTSSMTAAVAKNYDGFTALPIDQQVIAGDGSTVVKVYYDRNVYRFDLTNDDPEHSEIITPRYTGGYIPFGTIIPLFISVPDIEYEFAGWYANGELLYKTPLAMYVMPKNSVDLHAVVVKSGHTVYTVRHFLETYDGNMVEDEASRQILNGVIDSLTEAEPIDYEHYIPQAFEQKLIASTGNTVVDIYYTVKKYDLNVTDSTDYTITVDPNHPTIEYNREITLAAEVNKPGYEFDHFLFSNGSYEEVISENPCTYTMVGHTVNVEVVMRPKLVDYTIKIFTQPLELQDVTKIDQYVEIGSGTEKGYVDEKAIASTYADKYCPPVGYQLYSYDDDNVIGPTGATAALYYSRMPYKVTAVSPTSGVATFSPSINGETYRHGDKITFTANVQPGYKVSQWALRTSSGYKYYNNVNTIEVEVTETILSLSLTAVLA